MQAKRSQRRYSSGYLALVQRLPQEVESRLTNRALLMVGIFGAHSVPTGKLAASIPLHIQKRSIVRRMERFLDHGAVRVRSWYEPIACWLIQAARVPGELALVWDSTKVSAHHRLVVVGIGYRPRVIPLAWRWVRTSRGHCSPQWPLALLSYGRSRLPADMPGSIVGAGEFGHMPLVTTLQTWRWDYVLRPSGHQLVEVASEPDGRRLDALIQRGEWRCLNEVHLTATHQVPTHLRLTWERRYPTPWLLATHLTNPRLILRWYHRRLWIEETDGDLNDNGFDLERSALEHFVRLSRLTLAVVLLYVWFLAFGADQVQRGLRAEVDRADRRDLRLFRIAWDPLHRALQFELPCSVSLVPFFGSLPDFRPCRS